MKFTIGFVSGFVVGSCMAANMTEQQRAKAADAASRVSRRAQDSTVGRKVSSNLRQVGGAASERVGEAVDSAGDTITEAISADSNGVDANTA